jgi:hypothetical protein
VNGLGFGEIAGPAFARSSTGSLVGGLARISKKALHGPSSGSLASGEV